MPRQQQQQHFSAIIEQGDVHALMDDDDDESAASAASTAILSLYHGNDDDKDQEEPSSSSSASSSMHKKRLSTSSHRPSAMSSLFLTKRRERRQLRVVWGCGLVLFVVAVGTFVAVFQKSLHGCSIPTSANTSTTPTLPENQTCVHNEDCHTADSSGKIRVCVAGVCLSSRVKDGELCDDGDDCASGSCARYGGERLACCPGGHTYSHHSTLYCANHLPRGAPCRLQDDVHNYNDNHTSILSVCQSGLSCILGTCRNSLLPTPRRPCREYSDCRLGGGTGQLCAVTSFAMNVESDEPTSSSSINFNDQNKMCCPAAYIVNAIGSTTKTTTAMATVASSTSSPAQTTSHQEQQQPFLLTMCQGQALEGEACGIYHQLCQSGRCNATSSLCEPVIAI